MGSYSAPLELGRSTRCDIPVDDDTVSSLHAQLQLTARGELFVTDCDSTNGTFLLVGGNKRRIHQERVGAEADLVFGECRFSASQLIEILRAARADTPSQHYVRCACGHVRPQGELCPKCGTHSRRAG